MQSGGPYTKISALQTGTSYSDTTVASGATYFYVVTALGTNSVESGYSNEAMATVP
jgi:fibronectin type 3 domain-containing protein